MTDKITVTFDLDVSRLVELQAFLTPVLPPPPPVDEPDNTDPPDEEEPTPSSGTPAIPKTAVQIFDDKLNAQPLGEVTDDTVPASQDKWWISGKQPNASVAIVEFQGEHVLETAIERYKSVGIQTGARGFFNGRSYNRVLLPEKQVWIEWQIFIEQLIPIQQGGEFFLSLGIEGKMNEFGIWATNVEIPDSGPNAGKMVGWLQNTSGKVVYGTDVPRDPLPIGRWVPNLMSMFASSDKAKGKQTWFYENTALTAEHVSTAGRLGSIGLACVEYAGTIAGAIRDDKRYPVKFRRVRTWTS